MQQVSHQAPMNSHSFNTGTETFQFQTQVNSLARIYQAFWDQSVKAGQSADQSDLNLTECHLLRFLKAAGPSRMCDISSALDVPTSTLTYMVDRLVTRGYIKRERDPKDRRSIRVSVTDQANVILDSHINQLADLCKKALSPLSQQERRQLIMTLSKAHLHLQDGQGMAQPA